MKASTPLKMLAVIREPECIGCMKCIEACPVDAIIGSDQQTHTVIAADCIGCNLCVPPCPVDCIDLVVKPSTLERPAPMRLKQLYQARLQRLKKRENAKFIQAQETLIKRKTYVQEAILRARAKKSSSPFEPST